MRKRDVLLLTGMGLMIPCYLFTAGNVLFSPWPLYDRSRAALLLLTAVSVCLLLVLFRWVGRAEAFCARHEKKILALAVLFYLIVQLAMGHALRFVPITDAEQCVTAAQLMVDTGTFGNSERSWNYFTRCTNNLGFVYVLAAIFRFFGRLGWEDRFMQLILINSLLFSAGLLASARVLRRVGGHMAQMRFLILMALCFPLLYCTTEIYTDSFSLAFPSMIIYCAMRVMEAGGREDGRPVSFARHSALLWMIAFALLSALGAQIRFTVVIASIACLIAMMLSRKWLRGAVTAAVLAAAMLAGSAMVDAENAKHLDPEDMARRAHPILHYIAMGLPIHEDEGYGQYGYGGWYVFTTSFEDPVERREALLREVIDRVYYLRYPNRLLNMMSRKNLSTFGDGTFLLNEIIEGDAHEPDSPVKQVIFAQGAAYPAYYHVCTAVFVAQMLLACAACVQAIRQRETRGAPVYIALVGAFLLLCIWETRGRYFFQFEMLLLCAAAMLASRTAEKNAPQSCAESRRMEGKNAVHMSKKRAEA